MSNDLSPQKALIPLALTQFVASFAGSNMNVAINSIAKDLGTTVQGVQVAITMFLLTMAAFMITGSKLTDIWGRKRCLIIGLIVYGIGAVLAALAQGLPLLIIGYSAFEGVGSALMIPPVYIMTTSFFTDVTSRARAFGAISGSGGIGAAAGPLIGGLITTTVSWRASFGLQALIVALIVVLSRRIADKGVQQPVPAFDVGGAALSAIGMFCIVFGILQAGTNNVLLVAFLVIGAGILVWFYQHIASEEKKGRVPLLSTQLLKNRTSDLGMVTQNAQWLMLLGVSFVVSVFLQVVRGYSAIETGLIFTAATVGVLLSSIVQGRLAKRFAQRSLIIAGFLTAFAGIALLLAFARATSAPVTFLPGLFVIGLGVGVMLTPSVNVVQSAFPDSQQGEISGLSRSVSNLGSSLGTAIAGTILVVLAAQGNKAYAYSLVALGLAGIVGLVAAVLLPTEPASAAQPVAAPGAPPPPGSHPAMT